MLHHERLRTDVLKRPKSILMVLGPVMTGFGHEWKKYGKPSPFTKIQDGGITVRFRNIAVSKGATLYEPDETRVLQQLQQKLAALGCDPGATDGTPSQQTRDAALSCRAFPDGTLPDKLTIATMQAFLDAYDQLGVADFVNNDIDVPDADVPVRIEAILSDRQGTDTNASTYFHVSAKGLNGVLDFGVEGLYGKSRRTFVRLNLTVDLNPTKSTIKALYACGVQVDWFKRGAIGTEVTLYRGNAADDGE